MIDQCVIERRTGDSTDPDTGVVVGVFEPVYEGACKVQSTVSQSTQAEAGEHRYTVQSLAVHISVSALGVKVGHQIRVVDSILDPGLGGRVFRVVETFNKSFATAQRLSAEEVTS